MCRALPSSFTLFPCPMQFLNTITPGGQEELSGLLSNVHRLGSSTNLSGEGVGEGGFDPATSLLSLLCTALSAAQWLDSPLYAV
jgi:hypothetical protein